MQKTLAWFTPERRKNLYTATKYVGIALMLLGVLKPDQLAEVIRLITVATGFLVTVTNLLAQLNVNVEE